MFSAWLAVLRRARRAGAAGLALALGLAVAWPGATAAAQSPLTVTAALSSTAFGATGVTKILWARKPRPSGLGRSAHTLLRCIIEGFVLSFAYEPDAVG